MNPWIVACAVLSASLVVLGRLHLVVLRRLREREADVARNLADLMIIRDQLVADGELLDSLQDGIAERDRALDEITRSIDELATAERAAGAWQALRKRDDDDGP